MQADADTAGTLALFGLGGGEIILMLALILILFAARKIPELYRGLGRAVFELRKAMRGGLDVFDEQSVEAGRSLGGIYGRPAAQALKPDNQVAELYDPAVLQGKLRRSPRRRFNRTLVIFAGWRARILRIVRAVWKVGGGK